MIDMTPKKAAAKYFAEPSNSLHRQYLALRRFFVDGHTAEQVAEEFGYAVGTIYAMVRDFKSKIQDNESDPFFKVNKVGRKAVEQQGEIENHIIDCRKKYYSVPDIKIALDSLGFSVSESYIYETIRKAGFARLPRRSKLAKREVLSSDSGTITAPVSKRLCIEEESFSTQLAGLLCFMPYIFHYGIYDIINESAYPQTNDISRVSSILSFVALKLSDVRRYSADDTWCMDRGKGLFAALNVLPKAAWFSSYSSAVTRDMNVGFLRRLQSVWQENGLLSDTVNLDFTTIPYWGDGDPFENNWSGKRGKALASICAVIAQDAQHGIICYGDTTIRHDTQNDVVLEFMDFYHCDNAINSQLKYLVFDSRFTTYENLDKLNKKDIKFVTIRRRGKKIEERIRQIPENQWKKIKVKRANGKSRNVTVYEEITNIKGYASTIRQVFIKDNGKAKPAIIITNEMGMSLESLIQKYAQRWLVEKEISEQIDFFHLNRNSSGIVVKVDFDLTMTILAHNIYRLFALDYDGYAHCEAQTIFEKFVSVQGSVETHPAKSNAEKPVISVTLKKKRTLPLILEQMSEFSDISLPWLQGAKIVFTADSTT